MLYCPYCTISQHLALCCVTVNVVKGEPPGFFIVTNSPFGSVHFCRMLEQNVGVSLHRRALLDLCLAYIELSWREGVRMIRHYVNLKC